LELQLALTSTRQANEIVHIRCICVENIFVVSLDEHIYMYIMYICTFIELFSSQMAYRLLDPGQNLQVATFTFSFGEI